MVSSTRVTDDIEPVDLPSMLSQTLERLTREHDFIREQKTYFMSLRDQMDAVTQNGSKTEDELKSWQDSIFPFRVSREDLDTIIDNQQYVISSLYTKICDLRQVLEVSE